MNLGSLRNLFTGYMHRKDLEDFFPDFMELTEARINVDVDLPTLEAIFNDPATTSNPTPLPDNFKAVRSVSGNARSLVSLSPDNFLAMFGRDRSGVPSHYAIVGTTILLGPYVDGIDLSVEYKIDVTVMVNDGDTNEVLDKWPQIYLYGLMFEAHVFAQDLEAAQAVMAKYNEEIERMRVYNMNYGTFAASRTGR